MTTSVSDKPGVRRAFVPTEALVRAVECDEEMLRVFLTDGRILAGPLGWVPSLHQATPAQREKFEIGSGGRSLHWPELDEDLSVAGLMAGVDARAA